MKYTNLRKYDNWCFQYFCAVGIYNSLGKCWLANPLCSTSDDIRWTSSICRVQKWQMKCSCTMINANLANFIFLLIFVCLFVSLVCMCYFTSFFFLFTNSVFTFTFTFFIVIFFLNIVILFRWLCPFMCVRISAGCLCMCVYPYVHLFVIKKTTLRCISFSLSLFILSFSSLSFPFLIPLILPSRLLFFPSNKLLRFSPKVLLFNQQRPSLDLSDD